MIKALNIIAGDFNIDGFRENVLQEVLVGYWQLVKESTHLGGALLDNVYVKNTLSEEVLTLDMYFCDYHAVRVKLSKKDFHVMQIQCIEIFITFLYKIQLLCFTFAQFD